MSLKQAQKWLDTHSHIIPALCINQRKIIKLLEQDQEPKPEQELKSYKPVQYATQDPGLLLALMSKVNSLRGNGSSRDIIESPSAAMALLGKQASYSLFKDIAVAENKMGNPKQVFLFKQIINRCLHNETQANLWARECGFHQLEQFIITALLAYTGELLCCVHNYDRYLQTIEAGAPNRLLKRPLALAFPN